MIENKEKYNYDELLIKLKILCNALIKEKKKIIIIYLIN